VKKLLAVLIVVVAVTLGLPGVATAQVSDTDTQTVTIEVEEIAQIAASADPGTITIANATTTAGSLPNAVTEATTSLSWTSNVPAATTRKVTAALDADFTAGIVLKATVAAPAGTNGASDGQKTLSTVAADLFSGITNENCTGATIT